MNIRFKLFLFLLFFLVHSPVHATSYIESFNSPDSLNHYTVYLNGGNVDVISGSLQLSSPYGNSRYPYLTLNNDFLTLPYKSVEIAFKYSTIGRFGAGISLSDTLPTNGSTYDLGHNSLIWTWNWGSPPKSRFGYFSFNFQNLEPQTTFHKLKISGVPGSYSIFLDDVFINIVDDMKPLNSLWIGNSEIVGSFDSWPTLIIDSIAVVDSSPTKPTFPYLSQKDVAWADTEYDSAHLWAPVLEQGINRWGCALTSVAMVLQKYGVKTIEGNTDVNPDNLNTWLKSQPDGYIGPGLLNWLAITRYSKESFVAGHAPTKLEYERSFLPTAPVLPAIIGVPGHFVVAFDEDTTNWTINDPASPTQTTLAKTSTVNSVNRFVPSLTNLSYIMFVTSTSVSATLKNELGEVMPVTWTDEYMTDDVDGTDGSKLRVGMVAKPVSGKYLLETSQDPNAPSEIQIYLYDNLAQVNLQTFELAGAKSVFEIDYGQAPEASRTTTEIDVTPPLPPTLLSPADAAHVNTSGLVLDWSDASDPSVPVTYNYKSSWPNGNYGPVATGTNSYIAASDTPDQTYTWMVQACDNMGNCSEWSTRTLIVDSRSPSADIVFPTPHPSSNYFEVVFSELVDPIEATSGANYFLSNWPGAGGTGDLLGDANITYNPDSKTARILFISPDWYISPEQLWGVQNIHDLAGNILSLNPYSEYSTPMTTPTLTLAPTTTPNPTNQVSQTWSWLTATDVGSGVKGYSTRTYDVVTQQYLSDWLWIGQVLGTSTSLNEGSWKLSLRATDNAGNTSSHLDSSTLVVDTTRPSIPTNLHFDSPSVTCGGFTKDKYITIDWDDSSDNTKIAGYEYNVDYQLGARRGSWTTFFTTSSYRGSLNEGVHYIKLRSKDTSLNYSEWSNSCSITYDSLIPVLKDKTSFSGWYKEPQTSYFDFTDTNLPADYLSPSCEISTEGSSQVCSVTPNVCDKAANCFITAMISNSAKIDLSKPTVSLNAWGSTIDGTASDSTSGIDRVEIRLTKPGESETTIEATGTTNWSYTIDNAPVGHYKAIVVAYDNAGNTSDELVKEYDINPSGSPAGSSPTPTPTPSPAGLVAGASTQKHVTEEEEDQVVDSEIPKQSMSPSPKAEVLGETTEHKPNFIYWWLLLFVPAGAMIALIRPKR